MPLFNLKLLDIALAVHYYNSIEIDIYVVKTLSIFMIISLGQVLVYGIIILKIGTS